MTLVLGASHAVAGVDHVAIANPVGLVVDLSVIPAGVAVDPTDPATYHRLGSIVVGNALGFVPPVNLLFSPQLVYPLPPEFDVLAWNLRPGISGTVTEIVGAAVGGAEVSVLASVAIGVIVGQAAPDFATFAGTGKNSIEVNKQMVLPKDGTLSDFFLRTLNTNSAGGDVVCTVRKNAVDTALIVTIPASAAGGNFTDTTHTVACLAGDRITVSMVNNGTGGSGSGNIVSIAALFTLA